jgi:hypothetical protein
LNKKILLRIIIVLISLWIILLGIVYITNGKYLDHAIGILKSQLDSHLATEIQINREDIHLSFLKTFPYASIELNNILIKSAPVIRKEDFRITGTDTLLFAERISLIFDLKSLLSKKYQLKKVEIDDAILHLLSDKQGNVNYNIIRTSPQDILQDTVRFNLKKLSFRNMHTIYYDAGSNFIYSGIISNAEMQGSFTSENFLVKTRINSTDNYLDVQRISYLKKEPIALNLLLRKHASVYTLSESEISVFGIDLKAEGKYVSANRTYDLRFSGKELPLQKIKTALLRHWTDRLIVLPQKGDLTLKGKISGKGTASPLISLQFKVNDGILRDREKSVKITDFYVQGYYTNGRKMNKSSRYLRIDSLSAQSGKSILFLSGKVQNFDAPIFDARIRGYVELGKLMIIKQLSRKFELSGIMKGNINTKGSLTSVQKISSGDLKRILLRGTLQFENATVKSLTNSLPASVISGIVTVRNLQEISLDSIVVHTGKSDLQVRGEATHLPFFSVDKSVYPIYRCTVKSDEFHVEDFLPRSPEGSKGEFKIEFPDSLIVHAGISIRSFSFGKFVADNVSGDFYYTPKTVWVRNFSINTQEGKIQSEIQIRQSSDKLYAESNADLHHLNISKLFYAFNEFGQTVITHEYIRGYISGTTYASTAWNLYLKPIYSELQIASEVTIDNGELNNYTPLLGLSEYIEVNELKHVRFERLRTSIHVENEKVTIGQMQINSSAISLTGSGEHNFDNSYVYRFQVQLSDVLWKKAKKKKPENTEFGYVVDDGSGRHTIPLSITGKDTIFEVHYDKKTAGSILHEKISNEKQVWKELLSPGEQTEESSQQELPVEWEDQLPTDKTQDSSNAERKKSDFEIEWKDE